MPRKPTITAAIMVTLLALVVLGPAFRPAALLADEGLRVTGGLIQREISPGETFSHTFTVANSPTGAELQIRIEAKGFGQGLDGSYTPLESTEDRSPFSARGFITALEPSAFVLGPGQSQEIRVTVQVPPDLGEGTRYALIHIHTEKVGVGRDSAIVLAATVPVVLTPKGTRPIETGTITGLTIGEIQSGRPIAVQTIFENTGNHHYKAYNEVVLTDASGKEMGYSFTSPTASSILPGSAYRFEVGLIPRAEMPGGTYRVQSRVFREDGIPLAAEESEFTVTHPWEIFPPTVVKESIEVFTFTDEEPHEINAVQKSNLRILFRDTGKVTGRVITARYDGEPHLPIGFSAPEAGGGTGNEGIRFSAIHTEGFGPGTAEVHFLYTDDLIRRYDESSLFLAYWDGSRWQRFENIRVFTGAKYVSGEAAAGRLVGAPVGLGGRPPLSPTAPPVPESKGGGTVIGLWAGLAAAAAASITTITIVWRRRRKSHAARN